MAARTLITIGSGVVEVADLTVTGDAPPEAETARPGVRLDPIVVSGEFDRWNSGGPVGPYEFKPRPFEPYPVMRANMARRRENRQKRRDRNAGRK